MQKTFTSRLSRVAIAITLGALVVAACGGSTEVAPRKRNAALVDYASMPFQRSTVCTNFFGAYEKDMAAPDASVTLKFCPQATRYELTWANTDAVSTDIASAGALLTVSGSDFIAKGPLHVRVYRDVYQNDTLYAVPFGDFELNITDIDGQKRLAGVWSREAQSSFMLYRGAEQVFRTYGLAFYASYQFDQSYWFLRDRCRPTTSSLESEAFNLQFQYSTLYSSMTGWLGRSALIAKIAQESLYNRRESFRTLILISQKISALDSIDSISQSCDAIAEDPLSVLELTSEQKDNLAIAAPLLRDATHELQTFLCTDYSADSLAAIDAKYTEVDALVPDLTLWRASTEPDKAALEVAQLRLLMMHMGALNNFFDVGRVYGCPYIPYGQEVFTAAQIENYLHPTTTTTSTTSPSTTTVATESLPPTTIAKAVDNTALANEQAVTESTSKSTPTPTSNVATATTVPESTTVAPKPLLKVNSQLTFRNIAVLAGFDVRAGMRVTVVIDKSSQKMCKVTKSAVVGSSAGMCSMKVSLLKKKKLQKKATLNLAVAAS